MDVAVLYSGVKDSTFAIQHAKEKGWNIKYLISVKPTRKDCFLFHFATVEQTKDIANMLNIPHFYVKCRVADPVKEADIVREVVENGEWVTKTIHGANLYFNEYGNVLFGDYFFGITGFHGFHVFSGVVINIIILINVIKGTYEKRGHYEMVEKTGMYWHFVDLVWVFVFTFFYLL